MNLIKDTIREDPMNMVEVVTTFESYRAANWMGWSDAGLVPVVSKSKNANIVISCRQGAFNRDLYT